MIPTDRSRSLAVRRILRLLTTSATAPRVSEAPERPIDDPAVVGAAVLLACAMAPTPDLIDRVLWDDVVLVLTVPGDDVDIYRSMMHRCFGHRRPQDLPDEEGAMARRQGRDPATFAGATIVSARRLRGRTDEEKRSDRIREAVRAMRAVVGIAAAPTAQLPPDLVRLAETDVRIGNFDPWSLARTIEIVAGAAPTRSPAAVVSGRIRLSDLDLAVSRERGADGSLARLESLCVPRSTAGDGPRLSELHGYGEAKTWGLSLAADLRAYAEGAILWRAVDPGCLLVSEPGCGKTTFGAAIAREADVPFLAGSLAQWQSIGEAHLGTTLAAMRAFFDTARAMSPCIALVDELDSFGDRARLDMRYADYWIQIINGFLECVDGSVGREGVVLIGATNIVGRIDPAIRRAGRFDRVITIPLPSMADLREILRFHLGDDLKGVDLGEAARLAVGGTGADCAAWVRRARATARRDRRQLALGDLMKQIRASTDRIDPETERRIAVHECGHAVVGNALGFAPGVVALRSPNPDRRAFAEIGQAQVMTLDGARALLAVLLGGRAAEETVFGSSSAGSALDLEKATAVAWSMHFRWGLGEQLQVLPQNPGSSYCALIEEELRAAAAKAADILRSRREALDRLTEALLARSTLAGQEVVEILEGAPAAKGAAWTTANMKRADDVHQPTYSTSAPDQLRPAIGYGPAPR